MKSKLISDPELYFLRKRSAAPILNSIHGNKKSFNEDLKMNVSFLSQVSNSKK